MPKQDLLTREKIIAFHANTLCCLIVLKINKCMLSGRCCDAKDRHKLLVAALGEGLAATAVMLQAPGSFFAYEPVMRALQHAQMPLPHLLAMPTTAAPGTFHLV